jgi:CRP-like cAMP-binding protein
MQETETGLPVGLEEDGEGAASRPGLPGGCLPSLFETLPAEEVKEFIEKAKPQSCSAGQIIIEEGDSGDSIFLIKSGSARVVTHIFGKEIQLADLSSGDIFGEVAFLTGRPRTASVIALEKSELLEFQKLVLEEIFETYPEALRKLHDFYECRVQDTVAKVKLTIKK